MCMPAGHVQLQQACSRHMRMQQACRVVCILSAVQVCTLYCAPLACAGFRELCERDARFEAFGNTLFGQAAVDLDLEAKTPEANRKLDASVASFLGLLADHLLLPAAMQTLEFLVRRLRQVEPGLMDGCLDECLASALSFGVALLPCRMPASAAPCTGGSLPPASRRPVRVIGVAACTSGTRTR